MERVERCVKTPWQYVFVHVRKNKMTITACEEQVRYMRYLQSEILKYIRHHEKTFCRDISFELGIPYGDVAFALWMMEMSGEVVKADTSWKYN